jgi:hypothetical protein
MYRVTAIALLAAAAATAPPPTPRELYNQGVDKLDAKNWSDAEKYFLDAAKSNQETVQADAVYDLGRVRYEQGKETLAGEGNRQQILTAGSAGLATAKEALRAGNEALIGDEDVKTLVQRYTEVRSARKDLRSPRDETTRETNLLDSAIKRYRFSADNFHSAYELDPANHDADFNAGVMERHLAELSELQKRMQQQRRMIAEGRNQLKELGKKLLAKIPDNMKQPGDPDDDDEDDDDEEDGDQPKDKGKGNDEQKKEEQKGTGDRQQQRLGTSREIDPDVLKLLKDRIKPRTMTPGNDPEVGDDFRDFEFRQGTPRPRRRPGHDW